MKKLKKSKAKRAPNKNKKSGVKLKKLARKRKLLKNHNK
jgi:hypothetical protein